MYHVWNRFFSIYPLSIFFGELEPTLETEHFYIVGVNSIRRRYHTRGHISIEQIQATYERLDRGPKNKIKLVVFHQPFYTPPDNKHGIKDCPVLGKIALEKWSTTGLFGMLHGHLHKTAIYDLTQIYSLKIDHPIFDIHAGTATSTRLYHHNPNSFNTISNEGKIQHYWFNEQLAEFTSY